MWSQESAAFQDLYTSTCYRMFAEGEHLTGGLPGNTVSSRKRSKTDYERC